MQRVKSYLLIFLLLFLTSCGILNRVPQKEYIHDTTTVYQNNNIYVHDSVYVWRDHIIREKGDTVYTTITEYKDRWRIREVHDTTYKDRSVFVDREVPVEVEKKLSWSQKMFLAFGKIFSVLLLIGIGYLVAKFLIK